MQCSHKKFIMLHLGGFNATWKFQDHIAASTESATDSKRGPRCCGAKKGAEFCKFSLLGSVLFARFPFALSIISHYLTVVGFLRDRPVLLASTTCLFQSMTSQDAELLILTKIAALMDSFSAGPIVLFGLVQISQVTPLCSLTSHSIIQHNKYAARVGLGLRYSSLEADELYESPEESDTERGQALRGNYMLFLWAFRS